MVDFLWILMIPAPVLLGIGVMGCLYGKNRGCFELGEVLPAGFCVLIGVAEAAHLAAVFLKWPVQRMAFMWIGMVSLLAVVSVILIAGIGGLALNFGSVTITSIATALILGILTNLMLVRKAYAQMG